MPYFATLWHKIIWMAQRAQTVFSFKECFANINSNLIQLISWFFGKSEFLANNSEIQILGFLLPRLPVLGRKMPVVTVDLTIREKQNDFQLISHKSRQATDMTRLLAAKNGCKVCGCLADVSRKKFKVQIPNRILQKNYKLAGLFHPMALLKLLSYIAEIFIFSQKYRGKKE